MLSEAEIERPECTKFIADPCGSSKCAGCGKRRAEHRAALSAASAVRSEGVALWNEAIEAARRAAMSAGSDEPSVITLEAGSREAYFSGATSVERRAAEAIEALKK
jgi:hypothetical protein